MHRLKAGFLINHNGQDLNETTDTGLPGDRDFTLS